MRGFQETLEPSTTRLKVLRSTDWANRVNWGVMLQNKGFNENDCMFSFVRKCSIMHSGTPPPQSTQTTSFCLNSGYYHYRRFYLNSYVKTRTEVSKAAYYQCVTISSNLGIVPCGPKENKCEEIQQQLGDHKTLELSPKKQKKPPITHFWRKRPWKKHHRRPPADRTWITVPFLRVS